MKYKFLYILYLIINLTISAQNNCRVMEALDVNNHPQALITCEYPFTENGCIALHANYSDVLSTDRYLIQSTEYSPLVSFDSGTLLSIPSDDTFSGTIQLPFTFYYFGNGYDEIVIGDNGIVSFDTTLAHGDSPFYSSSIPNPALYNNTIYGLFHDITNDDSVFGCTDNPNTGTNECGEIRYQVVGSAPCRKFVINYNHMNHFNSESSKSTFQIILHETSNEIEIQIKQKPINSEPDGSGSYRKYAIVGIQNNTGHTAYSPEGRNNEIFSTQQEAWKFIPNGASVVSFNWYNQEEQLIGSGETVEVCTQWDENITLETTYNHNGTEFVIYDNFPIVFDGSYPRVMERTAQICDELNDGEEQVNLLDEVNQMINNTYTVSLFHTMQEAQNGINPISNPSQFTLSHTPETLYVKLEADEDCYSINALHLELLAKPEVLNHEIFVCDINNNHSENINLSNYVNQIVGNNSNASYSFYLTQTDAIQHTQPLTEFILNSDKIIYVDLSVSHNCETIEAIHFQLSSAPEVPEDAYFDICNNITNINLSDYVPDEIQNDSYNIKYFRTYNEALSGNNRITNINDFELNSIPTIFVRIQGAPNCYSIYTLHFNYLATLATLQDTRVQCDSDIDGFETFDLTLSIPDMVDSSLHPIISYFTSEEGALNNDSSVKINQPEAYRIPLSRDIVYVRFVHPVTNCVSINRIVLFAVPIPEAKQLAFSFCDPERDNREVVNLHSMDNRIIGNQVFIDISYFRTEADAQNQANEILSLEVAPDAFVYARMTVVFEGEELCFSITPIELTLVLIPTRIEELTIELCDINNDGSEGVNLNNFHSEISSEIGEGSYRFFDSNGQPINNISYYIISEGSMVGVRNSNGEMCHPGINIIFHLLPSIEAHDFLVNVCDVSPYNQETVNLVALLAENQPDLLNQPYTFYKTRNGALHQNANLAITTPTAFNIHNLTQSIFVRVNTPNGCYALIQMVIKLTQTPETQIDTLTLCDSQNDDEEYISDLSNLNYQLFNVTNYEIIYYANQIDAQSHSNPINSFYVHDGNVLYFAASYSHGIECSKIDSITFHLNSLPEVRNITTFICDNNNDSNEWYDLTHHQEEISSISGNYSFEYYDSLEEAQNSENSISQPDNVLLHSNQNYYYVKVIDSFGCYSMATIQINFEPSPIVQNVSMGSCDDDYNMIETFDLTSNNSAIVSNPSEYIIEYYTNYNAAITGNTDFKIPNPTQYTAYNLLEVVYAKVIYPQTGCFSIANISIEIYKLPKLIDTQFKVCDEDFDGKYDAYLEEFNDEIIEDVGTYSFTYYPTHQDAISRTNAITQTAPYVIPNIEEGVYVEVTNSNGCSALSYVSFAPNSSTQIPELIHPILENCDDDDDGFVNFNLNDYIQMVGMTDYQYTFFTSLSDAQHNLHAIEDPSYFFNTTPNPTIYVRITAPGLCSIINDFQLKVNSLPVNPFPEYYEKCPTEKLTLYAENPGSTYVWSTGETTSSILVEEPGTYSVTITNANGCETSYSVEVRNYEYFTANYTFTDQHTVLFDVIGESDYQFSLDGDSWQTANVFYNLLQGKYDVYIKDTKTGCVIKLPILVFDWYTIITPNGDGLNDTWNECNLDAFGEKNSQLNIFDRYGKSIYTENSHTCFHWDGKYQGRALPTDTYWFTVKLPDGRLFNGYIAIKNYFNGVSQ